MKEIMNKLKDVIALHFSAEEVAQIASFKPAAIVVKAAEVKTKDGLITLSYDGESLAVGIAVMDITSGTPAPAMDGEYTLEDGSVITVASGSVTEMKPADVVETPEEMAAKAANANTAVATQMANQKADFDKEVSELKAYNLKLESHVVLLNKAVDAMLNASLTGKIGDQETVIEKKIEDMTPLERFRYLKTI